MPRTSIMKTLSRRETEVARCIARAFIDKQIAHEIGVTVKTVKVHVGHISAKWELDRTRNIRVQIARRVWENDLRVMVVAELIPD